MRNYLKNLINNRYVSTSILLTAIIIGAILVVTFTPFKELPFIYNEF